jgi:hypothetical protein
MGARWHHSDIVGRKLASPCVGKGRYMSEEENKAVGLRFVNEVLNKQNLAALDELVAEDFVELDPLPGQEQGREGLK